MVSMVNACCNLTCANDFLQGNQHQLDRQESHTFIEEVQWAVKDEVPGFVLDRKEMVEDLNDHTFSNDDDPHHSK